ncbi:MAG: pyridoxal phosphate-dependent aminotransferase [Gammaproteobacteria bacterium]|nr:pyridoxal phosphate-dependent aminotransferase [Gammaproteobacteria bacterium]MBU1406942.1 pyridoxal phosphate-dependent aminotransferase [Gammaproteobacteria bacterium]MBU1533085.1 pyridoxal phosphate-dependent aminotransferase [Gammaproteobacteria bacterium]
MREISINARHIEGQPMFRLIDKVKRLEAQGRRIIHLEIGDPDFGTPKVITEAAKKSLDAGETHYGSSWGMTDFVEAIRQTTQRSRGFTPATDQVLVTPGANIAIFYAVFCLSNPGQEVLVPDPGFPTYLSAIRMCGAVPVPYPLRDRNAFRLRAEDIEPLITDKTRLLIINSPQNPTGAITEPDALKEIYELAVKHDLYVYSDEIYARMVYGDQDFFSIAGLDACKERVILSNGFSKAFSMTGWRLGAVVAPPEVAERMMLLLQTTSSCVSAFVQRAGLEAITGDQQPVREMMAEYKARRDLLVNGLNAIPGISCHLPGGAFYAFPNISSFGMTSEAFADAMLDKAGVALLPGSNFGDQGEGFVRICYASSRENISAALDSIAQACKAL